MAAIIPVTPAMNASSLSVSECETIEAEQTTSNSVLSNTFFIRKKEYSVCLCAGKIVWERLKAKNQKNTVLVENILSIATKTSSSTQNVSSSDTETQSNIKQFTIFYAKRMENSSNPNKWRHFSETFQNNDSDVCETWIRIIQRQIDGKNF